MNSIGAIILVLSVGVTHASVLRYEPSRRQSDVYRDQRHSNDVTYDADMEQNRVDPRRQNVETTSDDVAMPRLTSPKPPRIIPPRNKNDRVRLPANETRTVLVIGGGLAGMSAALELAERGYNVRIREAGHALGGRLASRTVTVDGTKFSVDNSFVSWMSNNYQFLDIVERLNVSDKFTKWNNIDYYFNTTYKPETIYNEYSYPYDIIGILRRSKNIRFLEEIKILFEDAGVFVNFNYNSLYEKYDESKFVEWIEQQGIPKDFYDVFLRPIANELRNDDQTISTAEMLKYFYLFYLSTSQTAEADRLIPNLGNWGSLIKPWQQYLSKKAYKRVRIDLNKPFDSFNFDHTGKRVTGDISDKEKFDYVVLTLGSNATNNIFARSRAEWSGLLPAADALDLILHALSNVKTAPAYVTVRLWLNKTTEAGRPPVIFTPDMTPLSAVVLLHLFQNESLHWAQETNGSVVELELGEMGIEIQDSDYLGLVCQVLSEFCHNVSVVSSDKIVSHDIPSLEIGQGRSRPNVTLPSRSGIENLFLAGDWLKTEYPSAIGEKAISTGREAANQILYADHVREATLTVSSNYGPGRW